MSRSRHLSAALRRLNPERNNMRQKSLAAAEKRKTKSTEQKRLQKFERERLQSIIAPWNEEVQGNYALGQSERPINMIDLNTIGFQEEETIVIIAHGLITKSDCFVLPEDINIVTYNKINKGLNDNNVAKFLGCYNKNKKLLKSIDDVNFHLYQGNELFFEMELGFDFSVLVNIGGGVIIEEDRFVGKSGFFLLNELNDIGIENLVNYKLRTELKEGYVNYNYENLWIKSKGIDDIFKKNTINYVDEMKKLIALKSISLSDLLKYLIEKTGIKNYILLSCRYFDEISSMGLARQGMVDRLGSRNSNTPEESVFPITTVTKDYDVTAKWLKASEYAKGGKFPEPWSYIRFSNIMSKVKGIKNIKNQKEKKSKKNRRKIKRKNKRKSKKKISLKKLGKKKNKKFS